MSACACNVACPSPLSSTGTLASTGSVISTLTTSVRASSNAQSSFVFPTPTNSASTPPTLTSFGSPVSSNSNTNAGSESASSSGSESDPGSGTMASTTLSTTTTSSGGGINISSLDSASSTGTASSGLGSSAITSPATFTSATPPQVSQGPVPGSSNISETLSPTRSWLSGGSSSISQSTLSSNMTSTTTVLLSSMLSSSVHWTNTTCTAGAPTSFGIPGTLSSTLLGVSSTMNSSSAPTPSAGGSVTTYSTTTSSEPLSTFPVSPPTFAPSGQITESGSSVPDTTCMPTPGHSSFFPWLNSTTTTSHRIPSATGGVISVLPIPSEPPLNQTHARTGSFSATRTSSAGPPRCTATGGAMSDESIENGDFERGLSPWSVDLVDILSTRYGTAGPGADGSCRAFRVRMRRSSQTGDLRSNLRLVSPLVAAPAPAGSRWTVSFWVRWRTTMASSGSYVDLYANYAVAHRVEAAQSAGGNWSRVAFPYTAGRDRNVQFVFSFVLGEAAPADEVWIDKVAIGPDEASTATLTGPALPAATTGGSRLEA
ncbi:hypothetical protein GGR52DRAFT_421956 [Hypoxylon sp. FL1284]|nr:hypothetical protein GGR52DRAFT_421956 [Hypoxylon sp. FL1284]